MTYTHLTHEQLEDILSAIPGNVLMIDSDLKLQYVNNPEDQGYRAEDVVGMDALEFIPESGREVQQEILERVLETGEQEAVEYPLTGGEGEALWFEGTMTPIERDDEIVGVVVVATNVTDRHRAEEEAEKLRKLLPVCSWCKRIRDDEGYWASVEDYLEEMSDSMVTHSMCPDCQQSMLDDSAETA